MQVTLPAAFAQLYHDPPVASCALTVVAAVGAIVKATWSRFVGVVAFNVYATPLTVYPLIAPEPEPALLPGTVLLAAYANAPAPKSQSEQCDDHGPTTSLK